MYIYIYIYVCVCVCVCVCLCVRILKHESLYVHCRGKATRNIFFFCNETVIMLRLNVRQILFYMAFIYFE